jgi:uncharacterized membrane-anchored protein YhcB (DUF1043 family)/DNA-directed RNA polymerase subunit RPC12/RpoP
MEKYICSDCSTELTLTELELEFTNNQRKCIDCRHREHDKFSKLIRNYESGQYKEKKFLWGELIAGLIISILIACFAAFWVNTGKENKRNEIELKKIELNSQLIYLQKKYLDLEKEYNSKIKLIDSLQNNYNQNQKTHTNEKNHYLKNVIDPFYRINFRDSVKRSMQNRIGLR